ncbi:DUF6528 family protein [Pedobacter ginsengisoli]|uniref:DUF6528 family protein n=1 Tax=Pedobacter ginsengisoli TaxID=363852 RepID=UPI00254B6B27|nr:DUF6528 family protein [Pedobacter ginsengisoli]
MTKLFIRIAAILFFSFSASAQKTILLTEQAQNRLLIVEQQSGQTIWEWLPQQSNVAPEHFSWFKNISEAKPLFNRKYVLLTASGGAVALVRISDKKTMFYANAGNNPHSAELLPDGNIVSAASTGNVMTLFKVDTANALHSGYRKTYYLKEGHNVVWDKKRQLLWATSGDTLKAFSYSGNCLKPELTEKEKILLPGPEAHDLFPVFGKDELWFTNVSGFYKFSLKTKTFTKFPANDARNIKSVSSGPAGYPVIAMRPKEKWWTDEVTDNMGKSLYKLKGLKIYKARWFVDNQFSYPKKHVFNLCQQKAYLNTQ